VFERYTERARRAIFFGRYEASLFASPETPEIKSEVLLLGILHDDKTGVTGIAADTIKAIREDVEALAHRNIPRIATSVDLPLSLNCRRALAFAAEEAARLNHQHIDTTHLILGLLRVEHSRAAELLRQHGVEYESYRKVLVDSAAKAKVVVPQPNPATPQPRTFGRQASDLSRLVDHILDRVPLAEHDGEQMLRRKPWTRLEALGHLIDWTIAHQQWLVQASSESRVRAIGYPSESPAVVQRYDGFSWPDAVDLWVSLNRLLAHVLESIPESKAQTPCHIGIAPPVALADLMDHFIEHCEDIGGQILAHL
jgi:Clp amino terminal domain, pathogenicity island component